MKTTIAWIAGLLVLAGVIFALLTTTVPGDRGRNEINLLTIHELSLPPGGVLTQPVPLQRPSPYDLEIPYRWREPSAARVEMRLTASDGAVLSDSVEVLQNSRAPIWAQPVPDGSFWQQETAAFHSLRIPSGASGIVILKLTRVDNGPDTLSFFASDRIALSPNTGFGTQPDTRPGLIEHPDEYLDLRTEYGQPETAFEKSSVYVSRLESLAPPWLPFPVPELLFAVMLLAAVYLFTAVLWTPDVAPISSARSR